jgi:inorganic pyrophosphatase
MRPLSELPTWDPEIGDLTMVIETPQGSRNKYSYDPDTGAFDLG